MCLYNSLIKNRKYTANKKNGGIVPAVSDPRTLYVPIGCGNCMECRKQKAREWLVRLYEEIKENTNGKFITLTFSNDSIIKLCKHEKNLNLTGYNLDNSIATVATRYFLERWRKKYGKSIRHWLVSELGHDGTENIHLHGILWTNESYAAIEDRWQYGFIWPKPNSKIDTYVNNRTINYIVKYVSKMDAKHKYYKPVTLCTDGIGKSYLKPYRNSVFNKYNGEKTYEAYRSPTGHDISLPIYYRNKIYTDEEREKLWLHRLDKNQRWVCGDKVPADDTENYFNLLNWHRLRNAELGYGTAKKDWDKALQEERRRELMYLQRIENEHGYPKDWDE